MVSGEPAPTFGGSPDSTPVPPHNLRAQPSALLGRENELRAVCALLVGEATRLLTLTGPPGAGKTRLAHAVSAALLPAFAGGVWFVGLEAVRAAGDVATEIAQTLGIQEQTDRSVTATLAEALRERAALLVLDNFEQVLDAGADIAELLAACPQLKVLVTSRAALRVRWEQEYPVPSLALPAMVVLHLAEPEAPDKDEPSATPDTLHAIAEAPAVRLFVERAGAVQPAFALTESNALAVAAICARLDGLPLAIELAAARVKHLAPRLIRGRLQQRLSFLTSSRRDLPDRQQTLRAALAWSYDLLSPEQQRLFRRFGVFAGGATIAALVAVGTPAEDALVSAAADKTAVTEELVEGLLDSSLLWTAVGVDGEPRYFMLETMREYAVEQLAAAGEHAATQRHHAAYFLQLVEAARPQLLSGGQQTWWLSRLDVEYDNIRAALAWAAGADGDGPIAVAFGGALFRYWSLRGLVREGRTWLERALPYGTAAPPADWGRALNAAGLLARQYGDYARSRELLEQSLALARRQQDLRAQAVALNNLALVAQHGYADYPQALAYYEQSLAISQELGRTWGAAAALNNMGGLAILMQDYAKAEALLQECLALSRTIDDAEGIAHALGYLGTAALRRQMFERAHGYLRESLQGYATLGDRLGVTLCLEELAAVAVAWEQPVLGARLLGAAAAIREQIAVPGDPSERAAVADTTATAQRSMGDAAFTAAWSAGHGLPQPDAVAEALALEPAATPQLPLPTQRPSAAPPGRPPALPDGITPREADVLRLIASGNTNREIAEALVLSVATVERHIANLYAKIGARGRADATAYALRHASAVLDTSGK